MKTMTLMSALVLTSISLAISQPKFNLYPDSIRIEMTDIQALVVVEMREYRKDSLLLRNFPTHLGQLLEHIKVGYSPEVFGKGPMRIEVNETPEGVKEVKLKQVPFGQKQVVSLSAQQNAITQMTITAEKGIIEVLPPGWEMYVITPRYKAKIYAADLAGLENIAKQDFSAIVSSLGSEKRVKELGRSSIESVYVLRNSEISERTINYTFPGDQISLSAQAGVGLFRDKFFPELSVRLGTQFRDRFRRENFRASLSYNFMFFAERAPEGGFTTNVNSFLSGMYEVNFNRGNGAARWSGLGAGVLLRRSGDYFTGNTAKFFVTHHVAGNRVQLVPEFYLTNDFKSFAFGMTLRYQF